MSGGNLPQHTSHEKFAETMMNLALLDPPRWGWTAVGGVADLLTPHERARRKESKRAFLRAKKRKRERPRPNNNNHNSNANANANINSTPLEQKPPPPPSQPTDVSLELTQPDSGESGNNAGTNGKKPDHTSDSLGEENKEGAVQPDSYSRPQQNDLSSSKEISLTNGEQNNNTQSEIQADAAFTRAQSKSKDEDSLSARNEPESLPETVNGVMSSEKKEDGTLLCASVTVSSVPCPTADPVPAKDGSLEPENLTTSAVADAGQTTSEEKETLTEKGENEKQRADLSQKEVLIEQANGNSKSQQPTNGTSLVADLTAEVGNTQSTVSTSLVDSGEPPQSSLDAGTELQQEEVDIFTSGTDSNLKILKTGALREDGSLDIYAYHRGREGFEPRDEATGELLCDVEQTDSNHRLDEPRLSLQVTVSFPLADELDGNFNTSGSDVDMFEDTITWNLGDPETPTPMAFAANAAEQFGLTFGQTVDLATSIQIQINRHVEEHCGYAVPVAMTDGAGTERTNFPLMWVPYLYGEVSDIEVAYPGKERRVVVAPVFKAKSKRAPSTMSQGSSSRRAPPSDETGRASNNRAPPPIDFDETVEDMYVDEVRRRMMDGSRADILAKANGTPGPPGLVELKKDHVCHICHKRNSLVGQFACGRNSHSYCGGHLRNRLKLDVTKHTDEVTLDHCPVCAVTCSCSKCNRRLTALALQLKRLSQQQGVEPGATAFDNIFTCYTKAASAARIFQSAVSAAQRRNSNGSNATESSKGASEAEPQTAPQPKPKIIRKPSLSRRDGALAKVKKARASEFPGELRNGQIFEAGTSTDYLTVFTPDGSYEKDANEVLAKRRKRKIPVNTTAVTEDGNFGFCQVCRVQGTLICCDFCPRAFHSKCLEFDDSSSKSIWECLVCRREKGPMPEYELTGTASQPAIIAAYMDLKSKDDSDLTQLSILSKIHEMVEKLIRFDFGYIFSEPVDLKHNPEYRKLIENPMDLGTIGANLVDGTYKKYFQRSNSWSDIHLAVLKDVELVWHNCFTFNVEGSAFYRSAEVLRKHMLGMRSRSLDEDLSHSVKQDLEAFVKECEQKRGKVASQIDVRPVPKHKITIKGQKGGPCRKMAVFDPDTGLVVKIYSTMKAAIQAAEFIASRGHPSELSSVTDNTVKALFSRSAQDPSVTLFGYRWLELEMLRNNQVVLTRMLPNKAFDPIVIEVVDGDSTFRFFSIKEALAWPQLPQKCSQSELQDILRELPEAGDSKIVSGLKWRRLKAPKVGVEIDATVPTLSSFWADDDDHQALQRDTCKPPENSKYIKEDIILRRILAGFATFDAAYQDWLLVCKSSTTKIPREEMYKDGFHNYYVDGDRNIDGIIWKTIDEDMTPSGEFETEVEAVPLDDNERTSQLGAAEITPAIAQEEKTAVVVSNAPDNPTFLLVDGAPDANNAASAVSSIPDKLPSDLVENNIPTSSAAVNEKAGITGPDRAAPLSPVPQTNGTRKRERSDEVLQPCKKR